MKHLAIVLILLAGVAFAQDRFSVSGNVITDNITGLEWRVGPDRDTDWYEARDWVEGLGGSWRMPTRAELHALYSAGITSVNWGPFENSGWCVWTSEEYDSSSEGNLTFWSFYFARGRGNLNPCDSSYLNRAFAVRSR